MEQRTSFSSEIFLYLLILLLALALRFAALGAAPLTEFEAQAALPAHSLAHGEMTSLGDQPGFVVFTSFLFSLLGSSEFVARLLPALFGVGLAVLPYFWRDVLGQKAALLFSLALALDPGMVATSRLASGQIIAVSASLIALTAWRSSQPVVSGIFASIALLASPLIFIGSIAAVFVWASLRPLEKSSSKQWRTFIIAAVTTLILGGTLFLRAPEGLGGIGSTLSAFIGRFTQPGVPVAEIGVALVGYAFPALVFGVVSGVNVWRKNHSVGKVVSLFAVFSLLLVLVNPGRQVADLLWVVLPLWVLAALQISGYISLPQKDLSVALGEAGLMLMLGVFFGIALSKLASNFPDFALVAGATFLLAILATILIAFGWSKVGAERGFVWALLLFSVLFMLSASGRYLHVETTDANDLWTPGPAAGSDRLVEDSLRDLSVLKQGLANDLAIESRVDTSAIAWELRDLQVTDSSGSSNPPLIITAADVQPEEFAAYRGQSFAIQVERAWSGWPPNFFAWLFYRQAPTQTEQIILWARTDLFPDAQSISGTIPNQTP